MLLPDVNVLVYAHRRDSIPNHGEYAASFQSSSCGHTPVSSVPVPTT